jgi:hypothetical protein
MMFFIGRTIIYGILILLLVFGYWIYSMFFADEPHNYFSMSNFKLMLLISVGLGAITAYFDPENLKQAQEQTPDDHETKNVKRNGSSATAKAGFLMGAAALAKTSKPSKIPQAVARDGGVRNINCHHKSKNKWIVTYETLHPSSGWISGKNEINPSISGFTTIGGLIDITWH